MASRKKIERHNRKLKKAQAFLALVKGNQDQELDLKKCSQSQAAGLGLELAVAGTGTAGSTNRSTSTCPPLITEKGETEEMEQANDGSQGKGDNSAFIELRKMIRERNKNAMLRPKIFLTPEEMLPYKTSIEGCQAATPPVYAIDVQHLLLFALQGNTCSFKPRWCKLLRVGKVSSVVTIFLDGVAYSDFVEDKESFKFIDDSFDMHLEVICPEQYDSTVSDEILAVPLSISQIKKVNVKVPDDLRNKLASRMKVPGKTKGTPTSPAVNIAEDTFSRVCLLLSSDQMKQEGYPLPVSTENQMYKGFVFTRDEYADVSADSPLFAVDCEMCVTSIHKHELTRVSVINESGETLYDTLVKPKNPITNYLTKYSGITKEMMKDVTVTVEDVQAQFKKILPPDAILCGQSLNCDLLALKMFHPYVIDTSVIYNMSGSKGMKAGLRKLSSFFLNRNIQNHADGHCSVEDAKATLDLVKLKLQRGLDYGDATINGVYFPNIQTYFLGTDKIVVQESKPVNGDTQSSNGATAESSESKTSTVVLKRPHSSQAEQCPTKSKKCKQNGESAKEDGKEEDVSHTENLEKRKQTISIFHQNNGVRVCQSFFKLLNEAGRAGCLITREESMSKFEKESVEKLTACSDKEACKMAQNAVESKEFTWVDFQKFGKSVSNPDSSPEYLKTVKEKMDRRVERVVSKTKERSLVVLVMTGRTKDDNVNVLNGGVFVKIT